MYTYIVIVYRDRIYMHVRMPCAMDSSAMDSSAMDSSAMESSSVDSSAMESSSVDSSAVDSSAREAALRKRRERDRDRRAGESSEQREARLSIHRLADRERASAPRGSETATQREVRLARRRIADRSRRVSQSQSLEEREAGRPVFINCGSKGQNSNLLMMLRLTFGYSSPQSLSKYLNLII